MYPYLITFSLISIFAVNSYFKNFTSKVILLFLTLLVGGLAGSRVHTLGGFDTGVYKLMYENLRGYIDVFSPDYFLLQTTERGFIFLMVTIKSLGINFNFFLLILGLFCGLAIYFIFSRFTKYPIIILAIFLSKGYLYYFFTAQRQIVAMCICWLAILFVINKKFLPFVTLIVLASLIHSSAIIFLPIYFINRFNFSNRQVIILILASVLVGVLKLGALIGTSISNILPIGGEKLSGYINNAEGGINILNYLELIPVLFLVLTNKINIINSTPYYKLFFNIFLVYVLITFAFFDFSFIARLKGYFIIGYIVVIASLLDVTKKREYGIGILIFILLYCFVVMIRELLVFDGGEGYLPYESFLFI